MKEHSLQSMPYQRCNSTACKNKQTEIILPLVTEQKGTQFFVARKHRIDVEKAVMVRFYGE
jgi:hypothetical protein